MTRLGGGGAVVDQDGDVDRLDGARHAQDLAADAVLLHDEGVRPEAFDGRAALVDRADVERLFADAGLGGTWSDARRVHDESGRQREGVAATPPGAMCAMRMGSPEERRPASRSIGPGRRRGQGCALLKPLKILDLIGLSRRRVAW